MEKKYIIFKQSFVEEKKKPEAEIKDITPNTAHSAAYSALQTVGDPTGAPRSLSAQAGS